MASPQSETPVNVVYCRTDQNQELVIKLFNVYYQARNHTGKQFEEVPQLFLVKPEVLDHVSISNRPSDKLIREDCIQRAKARNGYVGVIKHHNPQLKYYWLELTVLPFMLGDPVSEDNKAQFFYMLSHFVEYAKQHPNMYGDLTAELDSDKDLGLMLKEINKLGDQLLPLLKIYPEEKLVSFKQNWPAIEVKKLLDALKGNDLAWCEVFCECLIYVMGRKSNA